LAHFGVRPTKGPLDLLSIGLTVRNEEASGSIPLSSTIPRHAGMAEPISSHSAAFEYLRPGLHGPLATIGVRAA
jgi:hypothetical protein